MNGIFDIDVLYTRGEHKSISHLGMCVTYIYVHLAYRWVTKSSRKEPVFALYD